MATERQAQAQEARAAAYKNGRFAEFIADFLTNPSFRFAVLHRESTELKNYGLDPAQIKTLQTLKLSDLVDMFKADVLNWGADVVKLHDEIFPGPLTGEASSALEASRMAAASMYDEGKIFILRVDPVVVPANRLITLYGVGFSRRVEIRFKQNAKEHPVNSDDTSCGADLYQRVVVLVPAQVDSGDWLIHARDRDSPEPFDTYTLKAGMVKGS